jgi:DNA-directed RNA polymerase specialized sigma24 family protein
VQDAFASAVRNRKSFRGEGPLDAWLWRAVVNAARDQLRARRPPPSPVVENGNAHDDSGEVRDYAAIAVVLGVSEGTVAATIHASHRALRRRVEEARS